MPKITLDPSTIDGLWPKPYWETYPDPYKLPNQLDWKNISINNAVHIQEIGQEVFITIEVPGATPTNLSIEYYDSRSFMVRWIKPFLISNTQPHNKEQPVFLSNSYSLDIAFAYLKDGQLYIKAQQGAVVRNTIVLQSELPEIK